MAGPLNGEDQPITAINVTPLVDVTLVLVIIFMITMPFLVERAMRVRASEQKVVQVSSINEPILVELSRKGLRVEDRGVSWKDLKPALSRIMSERGITTVAISADPAVSHGDVVRVLDQVHEAGATSLDLLDPRGSDGHL
ncbi:MAG: biopolymer transporter ExbD [Elusimicrobia bacterium]|nr:biopolymer transporter ExbD [Elusimicrobiota bacterium]